MQRENGCVCLRVRPSAARIAVDALGVFGSTGANTKSSGTGAANSAGDDGGHRSWVLFQSAVVVMTVNAGALGRITIRSWSTVMP